MNMSGAHQVHGDIRINQNHGCGPAAYPRSISASIWSMSADGKFEARRRTDRLDFFVHSAGGFVAASLTKSPPNPFSNGHIARLGSLPNLKEFRVFK